jgi:hypothetical protein
MPSEDDMRREARRRGAALPNRDRRIAEARANEPRYMKIIRKLCELSGQELTRVTGGDPSRVHTGVTIMALHFITNKGHYHMIEWGGKGIMFRGWSTTERVCEVDVPDN